MKGTDLRLSPKTREVLDWLDARRRTHDSAAGEEYNSHYRGETGNDIECEATRRSCSPRASGRSASTEVSP